MVNIITLNWSKYDKNCARNHFTVGRRKYSAKHETGASSFHKTSIGNGNFSQ